MVSSPEDKEQGRTCVCIWGTFNFNEKYLIPTIYHIDKKTLLFVPAQLLIV